MAAPSGPGTHIREVIGAFENRGHEVVRFIAGGESLSVSASIEFKKRSYKKLIPSYVWQTLKDHKLLRFDQMLYTQLVELIKREKPDVIYERAYYLMSSGYRAACDCGVKYVCEINAPYPQEKMEMEGKSWFQGKAVRTEREQVQQSHKTIVVSSALKNYLIERTGVSANRILVTPNAVNASHNPVDENLKKTIKSKLNVLPTDKVIGFVGSIFPYHGVDILLEAFFQLKRSGTKNVKLLIVGDGEILNELKQKANASGYKEHVFFTGNVPHAEVYTFIDTMDITVMARSNWYGSPVKIFEYGAMKKLVIAPDEIPVHDVMQHEVHGFIIAPSVEKLQEQLLIALKEPERAKQMAETFYSKVMNEHTWQHVGDAILEKMK